MSDNWIDTQSKEQKEYNQYVELVEKYANLREKIEMLKSVQRSLETDIKTHKRFRAGKYELESGTVSLGMRTVETMTEDGKEIIREAKEKVRELGEIITKQNIVITYRKSKRTD